MADAAGGRPGSGSAVPVANTGRRARRLRARPVRSLLPRQRCPGRHQALRSGGAGPCHEKGCQGVAATRHAVYRAVRGHRPQPGRHRDHEGLHARLPLLPGGDDFQAGQGTPGRGSTGRRRRNLRTHRLRGDQLPQPQQQRLHLRRGAGPARRGETRTPKTLHRPAQPAHRILQRGTDGTARKGPTPTRLHLCARSRHGSAPRRHQQADRVRGSAGHGHRGLQPRLDHDQDVLHDRASNPDRRGCAGHRRPRQGGTGPGPRGHWRQGPGAARRQHAGAQAAYAVPVGAAGTGGPHPPACGHPEGQPARSPHSLHVERLPRNHARNLPDPRRPAHGRCRGTGLAAGLQTGCLERVVPIRSLAAGLRGLRPRHGVVHAPGTSDRRNIALGPHLGRRGSRVHGDGVRACLPGRRGRRLPRTLFQLRDPGILQGRAPVHTGRSLGLSAPGQGQGAPAGGHCPGANVLQ